MINIKRLFGADGKGYAQMRYKTKKGALEALKYHKLHDYPDRKLKIAFYPRRTPEEKKMGKSVKQMNLDFPFILYPTLTSYKKYVQKLFPKKYKKLLYRREKR